jgi:hypothetical protein
VLLPLGWCTAAVALVGQVVPDLDLRSTLAAFAMYALLLIPLASAWRQEWQRLRS